MRRNLPLPYLILLIPFLFVACTQHKYAHKERLKDVETQTDTLLQKAEEYMYKAQPDSSIYFLDSAEYGIATQKDCPEIRSLQARMKGLRAQLQHFRRQDSPLTIDLYHQAINLWSQSNKPEGMVYAWANLGDVHSAMNDLSEAVTCYRKALVLADSFGLPIAQRISIQVGLGHIYTSLHDWDAAKKCYEKTEQHFDQLSSPIQAYFLNNYGNYYYYRDEYKQALSMFLRLETLYQHQSPIDQYGLAGCRLNMADIYLNLNDTARAATCLSIAKKEFEKLGDPSAQYYCHTIAIGLALKRNNWAEVQRILAEEPENQNVDFNLRNIRSKYLRQYYSITGQWREAYDISEKERHTNDSLRHNQEMLRTVAILEEIKRDTLRLHQQMTIAQKDLALSHTKNLVTVAVATTILIGLLFVVWILRTRHREAKNQMSLLQLRLTNLRNRISPHFIFNILSDKIVHSDNAQADQLTRLSVLLRAGIDLAGKAEVSLTEELQFLHDYVETERYKLRDDFLFHTNIAPNVHTDTLRLPSMLVQILVENAIRHGLRGLERQQILTLNISQTQNNTIRISVEDNGRGYDARTQSNPHRKTGLTIVTQTILIYNAQHKHKMHFDIHNTTDTEGHITGCQSTLIIPAT